MIPQTPRHDFLHELHKLLRPAMYLEIGVQTGRSLAQAIPPTFAHAVDPEPQISVPIAVSHLVFPITSDQFFAEAADRRPPGTPPYDLAFIDGMHLVENALRDFIGVERLARPDGRTVAVFDDVLPYSADIAGRTPLPGDWTGDVWKINGILNARRPDLTRILVDVAPTGALVVLGLNPAAPMHAVLAMDYPGIEQRVGESGLTAQVVGRMRATAVSPAQALRLVADHLNITTTEE